jgi:hypothetical protein
VKAANLDAITAPPVAPGLPSELLRRRPDVAEAEAALAAAHADVDAARAAFFPNIDLTASGGLASTALSALFHSTSLGYSIGASLLQTIFDGGKLEGESKFARARQEELVADYRSAVLNAFADVESALGPRFNIAKAWPIFWPCCRHSRRSSPRRISSCKSGLRAFRPISGFIARSAAAGARIWAMSHSPFRRVRPRPRTQNSRCRNSLTLQRSMSRCPAG